MITPLYTVKEPLAISTDPTIGNGVAAEVLTVAYNRVTGLYYYKYGVGVRDWVLISGSAYAGAFNATWSSTLCRYYLVDNDSGSDENVGYVDAAANATIVPTGKAFKTLTKLQSVLPVFGNGRKLVILIKNRAAGVVYKKADGATDDGLDLSNLVGYDKIVVRGSTDLTNSAADKILAGAVVAEAGPGADDQWVCDAGSTTTTVVEVSGGLPAEPQALGYRIRFVGNETAALENICRMLHENTATNAIVSEDLADAPIVDDEFYLEKPGAHLGFFYGPTTLEANASLKSSVWGLRVKTTFKPGVVNKYAFIRVDGLLDMASNANSSYGRTIADENGTTRDVGAGLYVGGGATGTAGGNRLEFCNSFGDMSVADSFVDRTVSGLVYFNISSSAQPFVIGPGCVLNNCQVILNSINATAGYFGSGGASAYRRARLIAASNLTVASAINSYPSSMATPCGVYGVDLDGASDGVIVTAANGVVDIDDCVGTVVGNYGILIDSRDTNVLIALKAPCTLTGALGDIGVGDSNTAVFSYVMLDRCGFIDDNGNKLASNFLDLSAVVCKEARLMVNDGGVSVAANSIVRLTGAGTFQAAQADTLAKSTSVFGVLLNTTAAAAHGYVVPCGLAVVKFDGAISTGVAYVSTGVLGEATSTVPAAAGTNQKLRIGMCCGTYGAGYGVVNFRPEFLPVTADGNP